MPLSSRASQLFVLSLLVAHLSIPFTSLLASESGERHQHFPTGLWARSSDENRTQDLDKTSNPKKYHNKKETAKLKSIDQHNIRHHKKEKIKKVGCNGKTKPKKHTSDKGKAKKLSVTASNHSTPSGKPNSNHDKDSSTVSIPKTPAISSLLHLTSACGKANPTSSSTVSSGPNGHESFLNCGITEDGWNPPDVSMSMLTSSCLDQEPAKTTYAPCSKYRSLFEKHGKAFDIPPIFLAAFAMQESSCRPDVVGDNGGAFGLMQITQDKCGGAPNGNCADPDYNVKMGAKTFADGLKETNGNVLKALGGYNGWTTGLTKSKAMEAKDKGCCVCQQNLDYLHQFLNGWILGIDPIHQRLGTMRNLDVCGQQ